jgi:soluble lytic murein transglycosylase-like protein
LIKTESNFDPNAIRFEQNYQWLFATKSLSKELRCSEDTMINMQKTSWGLVQIMGAVACEIGFKGWCTKLCVPEINLNWGCEYLRRIILKQNLLDPLDIYAAWNHGSAKKIKGIYVNDAAVQRFKAHYDLIA